MMNKWPGNIEQRTDRNVKSSWVSRKGLANPCDQDTVPSMDIEPRQSVDIEPRQRMDIEPRQRQRMDIKPRTLSQEKKKDIVSEIEGI